MTIMDVRDACRSVQGQEFLEWAERGWLRHLILPIHEDDTTEAGVPNHLLVSGVLGGVSVHVEAWRVRDEEDEGLRLQRYAGERDDLREQVDALLDGISGERLETTTFGGQRYVFAVTPMGD